MTAIAQPACPAARGAERPRRDLRLPERPGRRQRRPPEAARGQDSRAVTSACTAAAESGACLAEYGLTATRDAQKQQPGWVLQLAVIGGIHSTSDRAREQCQTAAPRMKAAPLTNTPELRRARMPCGMTGSVAMTALPTMSSLDGVAPPSPAIAAPYAQTRDRKSRKAPVLPPRD